MSDRPKPTKGAYAVLALPLLMLLIFFVAPFGIMIAYSFYRRPSRLARATLSFSKKLSNHIGAIKYCICDYTLNKCAALPD